MPSSSKITVFQVISYTRKTNQIMAVLLLPSHFAATCHCAAISRRMVNRTIPQSKQLIAQRLGELPPGSIRSTPSGSGPARRRGSKPQNCRPWASMIPTGTSSAAPPPRAPQERQFSSPTGHPPARAASTSPWVQREPTAPAPTGAASPGRSRTNRNPRPGHPGQARTRHTEWALQPSYSIVDAL